MTLSISDCICTCHFSRANIYPFGFGLLQTGCLPAKLEICKLLCLQKSYLYKHSNRLTIYVFRLIAWYEFIYAK